MPPGAPGARAVPERGWAHEHGDRRGHAVPLHPRGRRGPGGDGERDRRAARHPARRCPRAARRIRSAPPRRLASSVPSRHDAGAVAPPCCPGRPRSPVLPDPEAVDTWALAQDPTAVQPPIARGRAERRPTIRLDLPELPPEPVPAAPTGRRGPRAERRSRGADGARERHPRDRRRGAQLTGLPPLPGGRRRSQERGAERAGPGDGRLRGGARGRPRPAGAPRVGALRPRGGCDAAQPISLHRLAIATGLATEEAPR